MIIEGFAAGSWGTNCYIMSTGAGQPAVIVDPGQDSIDGVMSIIREHRLLPAAVLLTHGHIDHVWSVAPLTHEFAVPALIHTDDRYRLADPAGSSFAVAREQLLSMTKGALELTEPEEVVEISENCDKSIASIDFSFLHTPGHTEGSMVFSTSQFDERLLFSGDVLFAGSIGRTDLPGGDPEAMSASLAKLFEVFPDDTTVLPGHGAATTIETERASNPFVTRKRGL